MNLDINVGMQGGKAREARDLAVLRKVESTQDDIRRMHSELTNLYFEVANRDRPSFGRRGKQPLKPHNVDY